MTLRRAADSSGPANAAVGVTAGTVVSVTQSGGDGVRAGASRLERHDGGTPDQQRDGRRVTLRPGATASSGPRARLNAGTSA
ncbi:MAG: hypothetical protein ACE368_07600 [Paracoccaceae bacterium]